MALESQIRDELDARISPLRNELTFIGDRSRSEVPEVAALADVLDRIVHELGEGLIFMAAAIDRRH